MLFFNFIKTSIVRVEPGPFLFLGSFNVKMLSQKYVFSNFSKKSDNFIANDNGYSFHSNELTIHNRNMLLEHNCTCSQIPCSTLCNLDFLDLVK